MNTQENQEKKEIHVHIHQTPKNKKLTIISGINSDLKKILTELKKKFNCGGHIKNDLISLQGDYSLDVKRVLIGFFGNVEVVVHGMK